MGVVAENPVVLSCETDHLPTVLLIVVFLPSFFSPSPPPPPPTTPNKYLLTAYCMHNTGVGWGGQRGSDCRKPQRQGPTPSPKVQMTKQRKNPSVINKLKIPNLEKQILCCLVNICGVAERGSSPKITKAQPFPSRISQQQTTCPPYLVKAPDLLRDQSYYSYCVHWVISS